MADETKRASGLAEGRQQRDELRKMWAELADQDAQDRLINPDTVLELAERHVANVTQEIEALRHLIPRMTTAGMDETQLSELVGLLESSETALRAFRDRVAKTRGGG